ncbi:MAG: DUF2254 domain-containing protein [Geminicoccaceae bacterium]
MGLSDRFQAVVQSLHDRLEAWRAGLAQGQSTDGLERLRNLLLRLRATLWLLPAVISVLAFFLAFVLLRLTPAIAANTIGNNWWLFSGDADTARNLLATLTSGMITMTSLVVSITVVVLTLAANQLGPRIVSTYMGDRQIKLVLGLFIGTILYLLTVLRSIAGTDDVVRVPHLAVTVGTALSVLCLFALLYYVHKIARSIIADTVVRSVGHGLRSTVRANLPERDLEPRSDVTSIGMRPSNWATIGDTGYVQVVDYGRLVDVARERDVRISLEVRAGSFVFAGGRHVGVRGDLDNELRSRIEGAFVVGSERTPAQDVEFAIRQLVEIALRALSPSVNDPFTAITVIHRIGGELAEALHRELPPKVYCDDDGVPRVCASPPTWDDLFETAFAQIRHAAADHAMVLRELTSTLEALGDLTEDPAQRSAIEAAMPPLSATRGSSRPEGKPRGGSGVEAERRKRDDRPAQHDD